MNVILFWQPAGRLFRYCVISINKLIGCLIATPLPCGWMDKRSYSALKLLVDKMERVALAVGEQLKMPLTAKSQKIFKLKFSCQET